VPETPDERGYYEAFVGETVDGEKRPFITAERRKRRSMIPWDRMIGLTLVRLVKFGVPKKYQGGTPRGIVSTMLKDSRDKAGLRGKDPSLEKRATELELDELAEEADKYWGPGTTE
jgi:hypothetical protein